MKTLRSWAVLAMVVFMSACGGGGGGGDSGTPNIAPAITAQPLSATVASGQAASFTVVATGTPAPTYQWKRNGVDIAGATSSTYSIAAVSVSDNGAAFTVVATNAAGSVTSLAAVLTVPAAPAITTQPAGITRPDGAAASFTVVATGTPAPTYQWKRNGVNIAGATSATYSIAAVTLADNGAVFSVVVTNSVSSVTSSNATLVVTPIATAITTQPASVSIIDGTGTTFSVAASGSGPLTYQWRRNGTNIGGANGSSYVLASVAPANNGEVYSVTISGPGGTVTSNNATLSVLLVAPVITSQPANRTVLQNAAASFTVAASGSAPLSFQWRRGGVNIPGATNSTYSIANAAYPADDGAVFSVIVSNDGVINGAGTDVTSSPATLTVTQTIFAPSSLTGPADASVFEGDAVSFSVAVGAGTAPFTYQWQKKPAAGSFANIGGAVSATYNIGSAPFGDNNAQYRVIVTNSQGSVTSSAATLQVTQQRVSLIAGDAGAKGNVDGTGDAARFSYPTNVGIASISGDAFVTDFGNQTIRRITPSGVVTTWAGTPGTAGFVEGSGNNAKFNNPSGIAVAADGTVYVADQANNRIRRIDTAGNVITIAGDASAGSNNGIGSAARFSAPTGVALSGTQWLYVADFGNNLIRLIDLNSVNKDVVTVAGTGAATPLINGALPASTFNNPAGIAVDPGATAAYTDDILYVADSNNTVIRKLDMAGNLSSTLAGDGNFGSTNGSATTARFRTPRSLVLVGGAAGTLYVTDSGNHTIRAIDLSLLQSDGGFVTTFAGAAGQAGAVGGNGPAARFNLPYGIAAAAAGTELLVANFGNDTINKITIAGAAVDVTFAGNATVRGYVNGSGSVARFNYPRGLVTNSANGDTYLADSINQVIRKITAAGVVSLYAGDPGQAGSSDGTATGGPNVAGTAKFNDPRGVALDGSGNVYVADRSNDAIRKIDTSGNVTTVADSSDGVDRPDAVVAGPSGIVYVANTYGHEILKIDTLNANAVTVLAGSGISGYADNTGTLAQFSFPNGLALFGNLLYVADSFNYRIRVVNVTTGAVTTLAGDGTTGFVDNATGTSAKFGAPGPLTVDATGTNLYMVDYANSSVRRINTSTTAVSTVVGTGAAGVVLGALPGGLNGPTGISVAPGSPSTRLVVSDGVEHVILGIALP
ncbi:MAG: immunoglobulin domain-containing protein [Steroidobacteraceae bacterium]